jgi:hypothetical protein
MSTLMSAIQELEHERSRLTSQLTALNNALSALNGTGNSGTRRGRMSAAGRARIAAAQRARWAKAKGKKVVAITVAKKRKLSAKALAKIRAAQKKRWAAWRKSNKKIA